MSVYRLIYIHPDEPLAYFTNRKDWKQQWGDDWNDVPYEHNAGIPYTWRDAYLMPEYQILEVVFFGPFFKPHYGHFNSSYSVEMINEGQIPWLCTNEYALQTVTIMAGETLKEFQRKVKAVGGRVSKKEVI